MAGRERRFVGAHRDSGRSSVVVAKEDDGGSVVPAPMFDR